MSAEQDAFDALCAYTLARGDQEFVHQHALDAFAAQRADRQTRPVQLAFALAGLFLLVEHQFSGRDVQRAHTQLASQNRAWPTFALPGDRGATTVLDVIARPEGDDRDAAIIAWCTAVWSAYAIHRDEIRALLERYGIFTRAPRTN